MRQVCWSRLKREVSLLLVPGEEKRSVLGAGLFVGFLVTLRPREPNPSSGFFQSRADGDARWKDGLSETFFSGFADVFAQWRPFTATRPRLRASPAQSPN